MTETRTPLHTGGCQCGAVRYALVCRADQPARVPLPHVPEGVRHLLRPVCGRAARGLRLGDGHAGVFRSSEVAERGFCRDCGTPLSFRYVDKDRISVSLGSLDDPSRVAPAKQYGVESRLPFVATLTNLPDATTEDDVAAQGRSLPKSRQYPDSVSGSDH